MNEDETNRRDLLCGLAAGATVGVTGCIDGMTGPAGSTGNGGFERVGVEETKLVVELQSTAGVETVNVIAPDGSLFAERSVSTGATRLEFELGFDYPPGEYVINAVEGDSTKASTILQIAPEIRINGFGMGANHLNKMPDSLGNTEKYQAYVSIENAGNGPESIQKLLVLGDVPNPSKDLKDGDFSGIYGGSDSWNEKRVRLNSGRSVTLFTTSQPFLARDQGDCDEGKSSCEVVLVGSVKIHKYRWEYGIKYSGNQSDNLCSIDIQRR